MNQNADERVGARAGWIGAGIGYCAWAVAVLVLLLVNDRVAVAVEVGLPCLLLSLVLWLLTVLAVQGVRGTCGASCGAARAALCGGVIASSGALLWLANDVVMPVLLADQGTARVLQATGSATHLPPGISWVLLAAGAVLLFVPMRRLLRRREPDS